MQNLISLLEKDAIQIISMSQDFGKIFSLIQLQNVKNALHFSKPMQKLIEITSKLGYTWNEFKAVCESILIKSNLQIFHCFIDPNINRDRITQMLYKVFGNEIQIILIVRPIIGFMIYTSKGILLDYTQDTFMKNIHMKLQEEII